jgi:hypothetical protein
MAQTHQPGQGAFRSILPEEIDWKPFPAFPPSVRLAVVVGRRAAECRDERAPPHGHPSRKDALG